MNTTVEKRNLTDEIRNAFYERGLDAQQGRVQALEQLMEKGLPGPKTEEYKFTPVARFLEKNLDLGIRQNEPVAAGLPSLPLLKELKCNVITFHNGRFSRELSSILDKDLALQTADTATSRSKADPFDLLNLAFHDGFLKISVAADKKIEHPVVIVYLFDAPGFVFANPRWHCSLGDRSGITLIEYSVGLNGSKHFNNKQSTIEAGANASLEYILIEGEDNDLFVGNSHIDLSTAAHASCFTFTFGGQLIRNNLTIAVNGEGVDAHLYGLYLLSKNTHADNHTVVDHIKPNSLSNELYKGVMDGNSKGVFNGKIYVRPYAQKTNAFQSNRNILLSEAATINTKPQLEIWADDVKCSHGCTTGQLDEDALFYLRSRGIPKDIAKGMMLYAFAAETLKAMKNDTVRNFIDGLIAEKLRKDF